MVLSDFGIGSTWGGALARVKFLSLDVARSEATPVSRCPSRDEVRAHAMVMVKWRVSG